MVKHILRIGLLVVLAAMASPANAASGVWSVTAFKDQPVDMIKLNHARPQEMATVVEGHLKLTQDGGLQWRDSIIPNVVRVFEYSPSHVGVMYAGTDAGLFTSQDGGYRWVLIENRLTSHKIVKALGATNISVFAAMDDGAGTPQQIYKFDVDGGMSSLSFPDSNVAAFNYDASRHRLLAGSTQGVYCSDDYGSSWRRLGSGAGRSTIAIAAIEATIWQLSLDGLFRSTDDGVSWNRLARPGDLNETYYGSDMRLSGLAVDNGRAFFGAWSIGYPYRFMAMYAGGSAISQFDAQVNGVDGASGRIWVATTQGLWASSPSAVVENWVQRPVLIIPGILGSMPLPLGLSNDLASYIPEPKGATYHTNLVLDPILHTYDGLISGLEGKGYRPGTTLFTFPYEWRQDNQLTAHQLADRLGDIRRVCGCDQIDVVAHSMGGLIARSYIQGSAYNGDVRNLIQIGTPNSGSVSAYRTWESGQVNDGLSFTDNLANTIFEIEALHHGFVSIASYIRNQVPSVGQLLPTFNYLRGRDYPAGYPRNPFLESLNIGANINLLKQRAVVNVVGSSDHQTPQSLLVGAPMPGADNWPDGEQLGSVNGNGDGTVLLSSLESIGHTNLLTEGDHGSIVAANPTIQFVQNNLMGIYLTIDSTPMLKPAKYLIIYVKSPVKLTVYDGRGNELSDTRITIPGGYYTGSREETQFAVVPDNGQDYMIQLAGTMTGNFALGIKQVDDSVSASRVTEYGSKISINTKRTFRFEAISGQLINLDTESLAEPSNANPKNLSEYLASVNGDDYFEHPANFSRHHLKPHTIKRPPPHHRPIARYFILIILIFWLLIALGFKLLDRTSNRV